MHLDRRRPCRYGLSLGYWKMVDYVFFHFILRWFKVVFLKGLFEKKIRIHLFSLL